MALAGYTLVYVALSTSGLLLMRRALPRLDGDRFVSQLVTNPEVLLGGSLYILSFLTFLLALRRFQLSLVYPVFVGFGYAAVALGAWGVLGERVSVSRGVGIAIVGVGLLLVAR